MSQISTYSVKRKIIEFQAQKITRGDFFHCTILYCLLNRKSFLLSRRSVKTQTYHCCSERKEQNPPMHVIKMSRLRVTGKTGARLLVGAFSIWAPSDVSTALDGSTCPRRNIVYFCKLEIRRAKWLFLD